MLLDRLRRCGTQCPSWIMWCAGAYGERLAAAALVVLDGSFLAVSERTQRWATVSGAVSVTLAQMLS